MTVRETSIGGPRGGFQPTLWTLVSRARDTRSTVARGAMNDLIARYWKPVYVFVRRKGADIEEAKDLTQGFFTRVMEKDYLRAFDRTRGRFRTFLLTALQHYCANERDRERAIKRGGGRTLSLDFETAPEPAVHETPERAFQRRWALETIDRALARLEGEFRKADRADHFEALRSHLSAAGGAPSLRRIAERIKTSEANVKVILHRARRRLREILRAEVAPTLDGADADDELRCLLSALR